MMTKKIKQVVVIKLKMTAVVLQSGIEDVDVLKIMMREIPQNIIIEDEGIFIEFKMDEAFSQNLE
jgi:hypothetical protein